MWEKFFQTSLSEKVKFMKTLEQDELYELIAKYLALTANDDEIELIENWVRLNDENRKYFTQIKNIWESSDKTILPSDISLDSSLKNILSRISSGSKTKSFWFYWNRVAAILILVFITAVTIKIFYNSHYNGNQNIVYNEVYATYGTRSALKLSDGSSVWLNSGSSLKYPDKFCNGKRTVYLKGEAYFEVHSDVTQPFIVQTSTISVKATGTKFCVSAYTNDNLAEVTLIHGKVFVTQTINNMQSKEIAELQPDQHLVLDTLSGKVDIKNEDGYKYIAWKDGRLVFRNEPFSQVIKKISQLYKVDIEIQGNELNDYRYRATFEDESLSEILKLLKLSSPIDYKEIKRKHLQDGTFTKRKIIIYKRRE